MNIQIDMVFEEEKLLEITPDDLGLLSCMLAFTPGMEHRIAPLVYTRIRVSYEVVKGDHPAEYNTMTNFASHFRNRRQN